MSMQSGWVFSVIYLLMIRFILLGFGFLFWWVLGFFLFILFCLTYFRCHRSKDKQQTVVLLHISVECWSLLEVKHSQ